MVSVTCVLLSLESDAEAAGRNEGSTPLIMAVSISRHHGTCVEAQCRVSYSTSRRKEVESEQITLCHCKLEVWPQRTQ